MQKLNKVLDMVIGGLFILILGLVQIPHNSVDKELDIYLTDFKSLARASCNKYDILRNPGRIDINFTYDLEDQVVGQCRVFVNTVEIKIDHLYWQAVAPEQQYQVIMHELTHCFLGSWYKAKFPFHVPNEGHYMFWRVSNLDIPTIQRQIIEVMQNECK